MALFKIYRGDENNLPATLTDGYAYFCTNTGTFYIDWADSEGNVSRKQINAEYATKLRYKDDNGEWVEIDAQDLTNITVEQTQVDWNENNSKKSSYILNRPFGQLPDTIEETTSAFAVDTVYSTYPKSTEVGYVNYGGLNESDEYIVTWDGVEYPVKVHVCDYKMSNGPNMISTQLGNPALMNKMGTPSLSATSEPFLMNTLGVFAQDGNVHTFRLRKAANTMRMDAKYLPEGVATEEFVQKAVEASYVDNQRQVDWLETDETSKAFILNKPELARVATAGTYAALKGRPFGDVTVVLEEVTLHFAGVEGLPNYAANTPNPGEMFLGETYRVMWDGTEHLCVCTDGVIIEGGQELVGSLSLGNKALFWGNGVAEDTGEPFYINWREERLYLEGSGTAETHTVSITPVNTVKKLDKKYLPDGLATEEFVKAELAKIEIPEGGGSSGGGSEEVILAEQTLSFTQSTLAECYQSDVEIPFVPPVGATFTVVWDGEEYTVDGFSDSGAICLGNASICGVREDTGEPFLYAVRSPDTSENGFFFTLDESSSHTVAIYKVTASASGGVSSWNDLTDKPFWTEEVSAKVTADTVNQNVTFDGLGSTWVKGSEETLTKEEIIGASIEACSDGQIMTLPFPVAESNIVVANDNGTAVLIAEYELAFVMCYQAGEITITALGTTETVNIPEPGFYLISDVLPSTAADGGYIKICKTVVKKIDDQYQHQSDWDEEDEDSAARILNKPFGVVLAAGTVVTDCTAKYFDEDFGLMLFDLDTFERHLNGGTVVEGVSYTANLGDYEYTGIGISAAEVTEITRNTSDGGIKFLDESGNHVCTLVVNARGLFDCIPFVTEYKTLFTGGKYYPVKITVTKEVVKKIDAKYLPGPPEFDLTAMGLPALTMDGTSVTVECDTTELRAALDKGPVKLIFTANVGTEVTVSGVVNAMFMADTYQCGFVGSLTVPMLLSFEVSPTGIIGRVVSLAASTT